MENQGQSFAYLYHQALVNPKEVSLEDFNALLTRYPYSQPLHFALERRKFLRSELNKLGNNAILLANSPNWLYEYVQLPVKDAPYIDVFDNDYVPYDEAESSLTVATDETPQNEVTEQFSGVSAAVAQESDEEVAEELRAEATETLDVEESLSTSLPEIEPEAPAAAEIVPQEEEETPALVEATAENSVTEENSSALTSEEETPVAEEEIAPEAPAAAEIVSQEEEETPALVEATAENSVTEENSSALISEEETSVVEEEIAPEAPAAAEIVPQEEEEAPARVEVTAENNAPEENSSALTSEEESPVAEEEQELAEPTKGHGIAEISDEEHQVLETLVQEGIGGGDYFALHRKEIRWEATADSGNVSVQEQSEAPSEQKAEDDEVSLYNDELMPYSFRWWLHKTRLEYADTYQPFASPHLPTNKKSAFDPVTFDKIVLDQQIRENIIHLQRPEDKLSDEVKQRAVAFARVDKTSEVIEKFIREEPQIQPPPADQLNMENKARKSSEEQFDLVTETLATIYASQAMYVKAIEVYKKLILKYPEKKSYFASQIKTLEEKLY
ncbi:hypothetical protein PQ465_01970 [Sphingobacterium oryzagri]|uniref:Tetratricopeptide repeat protein n=1 Tax=Sphingobacterium oryzagri TaxID=3025669 RepID=A0ABY7WKP4_9SPHI|nr:hypothetical protein [Sphingobacterium sp. KACC 22765]WDF69159.1 hypothetical protein PQ465_01970 [Sphingobacterium sp. KACC 22765]